MTAQWAAELRASPVITFDFCALRFDWFLPLRQARDDRKAGYVGGAKRAESTAKPQRDMFQEQWPVTLRRAQGRLSGERRANRQSSKAKGRPEPTSQAPCGTRIMKGRPWSCRVGL